MKAMEELSVLSVKNVLSSSKQPTSSPGLNGNHSSNSDMNDITQLGMAYRHTPCSHHDWTRVESYARQCVITGEHSCCTYQSPEEILGTCRNGTDQHPLSYCWMWKVINYGADSTTAF